MKKLRRWLYLVHRWLGIIMCVLLAMWFFSGMVMMYVSFPGLTRNERLASLGDLHPEQLQVGPDALFAKPDADQPIAALRLNTVRGRPAWHLRLKDGTYYGLFADDGSPVTGDDAQALQASVVYAQARQLPSAQPVYETSLEMDQWSVSSRLNPHRPLHRVALNDTEDTKLYISSVTGEVVRDTTGSERFWNWLGANLHWIYPIQLRRHASVWHWVVVVLSITGLVAIITGIITGFWRLRLRKRYRGKNVTPYRGMMKVHHIAGLLLLIPLVTYMLSGLLSMNPWDVFTDEKPFTDRQADYRQAPIVAEFLNDKASFQNAIQQLPPNSREIQCHWIGGQMLMYAVTADGQRHPLIPVDEKKLQQMALQQLQAITANNPITAPNDIIIEKLETHDAYYYSHRDRWRPLPILRVKVDNAAQSWFHVDLTTGELIQERTLKGRWKRWLYNGLHSLDFRFLIEHRPAWDVVVILLCGSGLIFAVSAVVIAWRRLRAKLCSLKV